MRPVDVTINGLRVGDWIVLELNGGLYANPEAFEEWRLIVAPGEQPLTIRNQRWLPLFTLPGYRARFDMGNQSLDLEFSPAAFTNTRVGTEQDKRPELSPKEPAAFVNYDVSHTLFYSNGAQPVRDTGALAELGLSYGPGVLTSGFVGRNLDSGDPTRPAQWRRLETTWTRDFPDSNRTLRLGDTSTRSAMWGRTMYFGGFQIGTNFGLTPGFLSQPIPTLAGTASGPSTVELYVNNALRQTLNVPAGPFTVENFSQLTGAGEARVVVRDVLGRESVIQRSFFSNASLLEKDLEEWSIDVGKPRLNLGTDSADYGSTFSSGLYRRGISQRLTLESRGEFSRQLQNVGVGANAVLPFQSLGQAAVAMSNSESSGSGTKLLLGIDQQSLRSGFGVRMGASSRGYRQLGFADTELPYKLESAVSFRYSFGEFGAFGVSSARITSFASGYTSTVSASFSMRVAERGSLVFTQTHLSGSASGNTFIVSLMIPLDGKRTVSASATSTRSRVDAYASVSEPISSDTGLGWRALTGQRANQGYAEGGMYYQGNKGYLSADLSDSRSAQTVRFNAQGALVIMDRQFFASRRLQDSFALVEVPGYAGVGVGNQGNMLARTDASGKALLARLVPYQNNGVRLDPNDLPFSAEIDSIERNAVPAWRSGVKVTFPVRSGRGALLRIVLDDGAPAPAGAQVALPGDDKEFFVARRGEAFVTGLQDRSAVLLEWKGKSCTLDVQLPPSQPDEIPRVGPLLCSGVAR